MVLVDQLQKISSLPGSELLEEITAAWQQAAFSEVPDSGLKRYFDHQLNGLANLPADWQEPAGLVSAIEKLLSYYPGDPALLAAPRFYRQKILLGLDTQIKALTAGLADQPQYWAVLSFLTELRSADAAVIFTYGTLRYAEQLVMTFDDETLFADQLIQFNFNHLGYFNAVITGWANRLSLLSDQVQRTATLREEKARIGGLPEITNLAYHHDWPSLKTMLLGWLNEQLALEPLLPPALPKLALRLSVAQLACLLRLAYEEEIFQETNLAALFRFFTLHFSAKKQHAISAGSLSKEFYSISQVTAAVTRDKLQKLVGRLNRNFFPVWFAVNVISLFC